MASREGHARFAGWLLSLAQRSLESGDYGVTISAAVRGLEEVIDAYTAEENLHFHDDYPGEGWAKRQEWLRSRRPEFDAVLHRFVETLVFLAAGSDGSLAEARVRELHALVAELSSPGATAA